MPDPLCSIVSVSTYVSARGTAPSRRSARAVVSNALRGRCLCDAVVVPDDESVLVVAAQQDGMVRPDLEWRVVIDGEMQRREVDAEHGKASARGGRCGGT